MNPTYFGAEYTGQTTDQFCRIGAREAPPDLAILGDSHALSLAPALDQWLTQSGRSAVFVFRGGCMPVLDAGDARCQHYTTDVMAKLPGVPSLQEVMLISIWRQPFEGAGMLFSDRWVTRADTPRVFTEKLSATVTRWRQQDLKITLIDPLFAAPANVPDTLAYNMIFGLDRPIHKPRAQHEAEFADLYAAFDQQISPEVRRVSLIEDFCQSGICESLWQGRPVFTDNNHPTLSMAPEFVRIFMREMAR